MSLHRMPRHRDGFTLVELLVSMVIVTLLVVMLVSMTNSVGNIWSQTTAKAEEFRDAREAFDSITRKLSQVTLNPYLDYVDSNGNFRNSSSTSFTPMSYKRRSELRFISGDAATLVGKSYTTPYSPGGTSSAYLAPPHAVFFQAPLGSVANTGTYANLENVLNTVGYFIEYGDDGQLRPAFITTQIAPLRYRFRLMEMVEPSDQLTIYNGPPGMTGQGTSGNPSYVGHDWFTYSFNKTSTATPPRPVTPLAENIVALIILPQLSPADQAANGFTAASLAPAYLYDSTGTDMSTISNQNLNPVNQLPPVIQVTMVAVDESSFSRLHPGAVMPSYTTGLFTDPTNLQADLNQLQANLLSKNYAAGGTTHVPQVPAHLPLNYRIFTTSVSVKAAKWSRSQTN